MEFWRLNKTRSCGHKDYVDERNSHRVVHKKRMGELKKWLDERNLPVGELKK